MKKIVIISGGKAPSFQLIKQEIKNSSLLICADSGANCLYQYKIIPDYIIGDFDSINNEVLDIFRNKGCTIEKYPKEKDFTDTEICLNKSIDLGAEEIVFLGCTGSRIDHVLANIGLLLKCLTFKIKAYIKDDNNSILLSDESLNIYGKCGEVFSLQAYGEQVKELTLKGCKYPLNKYNLKIGEPITVSNEFLDEQVSIDFKCGRLLIMYSKD